MAVLRKPYKLEEETAVVQSIRRILRRESQHIKNKKIMAGQPPPTGATNVVESMAQALVTVISRELSSGRNTPVSTPARPPCGLLNNSTPSCNSTVQTSNTITDTSTRVNEALKRQFPNMFKSKTEAKKGKGRFARTVPIKHTDLTVCVLPAPTTVTPKATAELELSQAGLGKKVVSVSEDCKHEDVVTIMEEGFSKLHQIQGRWMLYKATGGSGQRQLSLISMESEGYSGRQLRSVSNSGKNVIFLVPLQEELDTQPLPYNSAEYAKMPKVPCVTCNTTLPLQLLALHAEECKLNSNEKTDVVIVEDENEDCNIEEKVANTPDREVSEDILGMCPICQNELPLSILPYHGSLCAERSFRNDTLLEDYLDQPGPSSMSHTSQLSSSSEPSTEVWKTVENPQEAIRLFFERLREGGKRHPSLLLSLDARDTDEERDRSLISFYKQRREKDQWAAPLRCHIQGDAAIGIGVTRHILSTTIAKLKHGFKLNCGNAAETTLFEGESDHLLPTASSVLLESDLLIMAGRMIGHSLINQGPALAGLSLAIVYSLTSETKDTATTKLCLEDCPDIEHRETIALLLKDELTEDDTLRVTNLCLEWYFTVPNKMTNKMLLFQQLLTHAVLGRLSPQLKQLKKGFKETGVWPLLSFRPHVLPLLFPRESEAEITPQMILQAIQWPQLQHSADSEDSESDDLQPEKLNLISGFVRTFVEHASPKNLRKLMKFWVGWEVVPRTLNLEIVLSTGQNPFPKAYTCYERLRLPDHYTSLSAFTADMMVCLRSVESGFGLV